MIKTKVKKGETLKDRSTNELVKLIGIGNKYFYLIDTDLNQFTFPLESFKLRLQYDIVPDHFYLDYVNRKHKGKSQGI